MCNYPTQSSLISHLYIKLITIKLITIPPNILPYSLLFPTTYCPIPYYSS